jgi:hypothetical protein
MPQDAGTLDELDQMGLPPLWSQEDGNPVIQLRFHDPSSGTEWYVIEGSRQLNDYRFYGYQVQNFPIRCHFRLSDLRCRQIDFDVSPRGKRWSEIRMSA